MSYFYSVNRDNPLGYFSIDFNYRYSDFDAAYTPYGGTVNLTPGSAAYSTLPISDPYRLISNYASISQLKITDQSYINNIPTVFGIGYSSPIVSGNKYAAQITTNSSLDIANLYDAFVPASQSDTWSAEFWASLDWMDGQGINASGWNTFTKNNYRTDIGFRSTFNSQAKINLMDVGYYAGTVWTAYGSVVYNQSTNCIEFYVPKKDKSYAKAYAVIKNLDAPMHIYVSYSNKTINVILNGETGISASVGDGLYSDPTIGNNSQNLKFRVSGEIYNPLYPNQSTYLQNGQYFLISNLAFYNYILNANQISSHMRWASYDNKPTLSSIQGNTHFFTLEESQENFQYKKTFVGKDFNNYTQVYNLNITSDGLSPSNLSRISFNNIDGTSVLTSETDPDHDIYSVSPDPGVSWLGGKAALEFNQFGSLVQLPCTISIVVEPMAYNNEYIFSISGVNGISTLYLERSGTSTYSLVYFDAMNGGTTTTLASVTSTNLTDGYHKLALSLTSSSAQLTCVSSPSQYYSYSTDTVATATSTSQNFSFSPNSSLTIGQSYHTGNSVSSSSLRANSSQFSYLGIVDSYLTDFSYTDQYINGYHYSYGFPWTQTLKYSSPLQYNGDFYNPTSQDSTFPIYQMGYWITTIPLTSVDAILGSKIDWSSSNSCLVEYSFYNPNLSHQEQNWYTLSRRGSFVSGFDFTKELSNMLIRVTILSEYDVGDLNQTFNNLQIAFYRNMNFYSDDGAFVLKPKSSSIYNSSYTIKSHAKSVQSRSNNLGVLFPYSSHDGSIPGYGQIVNTNGRSLQGIDFWFRPDTNYKGSVILSVLSSVSNFPHLYINAAGALAWNSNISKVYINGQSVTNASTAVTADDFTSEYTFFAYNPIHVVVVFTNSYSGDLYINGVVESTSTQSQTFDSTNQSGATSSYSSGTTTFNSPGATNAKAGQNTTTGTFTVTAGRTYTVTAQIQEVVNNSRTTNAYISYYNSSGTLISTLSQTAASISTVPTLFTYATTAPTNATYAAVGFQFNSVHVNETYNIGNLAVNDSVVGNLTVKKIGDSTGSTTTNCTVSYNIAIDSTTVVTNSFVSPISFSQNTTSNRFTIVKKAAHYATASVAESSAYSTLGGTRSAALGVTWIDSSGNVINTAIGSQVNLSTSASNVYVLSFPPDNAAYGNYNFYLYNLDVSESYTMTGLTLTLNSSGPESSFGFINLWDNIITPTDPINRYALFTTNTVALYSNDNYMNDPSNKLSFDLAKESLNVHKIGN
jgi:hypothetical protein